MITVVMGLQDREPGRVAGLPVPLAVVDDTAAGGALRFNDLKHQDTSAIVLICRTRFASESAYTSLYSVYS